MRSRLDDHRQADRTLEDGAGDHLLGVPPQQSSLLKIECGSQHWPYHRLEQQLLQKVPGHSEQRSEKMQPKVVNYLAQSAHHDEDHRQEDLEEDSPTEDGRLVVRGRRGGGGVVVWIGGRRTVDGEAGREESGPEDQRLREEEKG